MMNNSILLINNNGYESHLEKKQLEQNGYIVQEASLDFKLPMWSENGIYDLFVLNLSDKMSDYTDWLHWKHTSRCVPVMVLTSCLDENFTIRLLDAGADDVVLRPFTMRELQARIRAMLRRKQHLYQFANVAKIEVRLGDITLRVSERRVFVGDHEAHLTRTEFNLFWVLINRLDDVCSHNELLGRVWGWEYSGTPEYLYVYMGRLRNKLGECYTSLLETIPKVGYILHSKPESGEVQQLWRYGRETLPFSNKSRMEI